ncbi:unnamed protein product [Rhizophagus irregularis]|nr:unnamed protein product [Rhizophagus irregularis]
MRPYRYYKSDEGKYGQKNHFLWIKNPDALIYKDTSHKGKKNGVFGLGEAPQRVETLRLITESVMKTMVEICIRLWSKRLTASAIWSTGLKLMRHGAILIPRTNATEEFVRRLDKELRRINEVLEVK